MNTNPFKLTLPTALLLCSMAAASAAVQMKFQVDMSTAGTFDTVEARGSFSNWTGGFTLVADSSRAGVYTNTATVPGTLGDAIYYKFVKVIGGNATFESFNNDRTFSLPDTSQSLPTVYFDGVAPASGGPRHSVTFRVNMNVQIQLGNFTPGVDTITARGTFQSPNQWSTLPSAFALYDNGTGVYTNTYSNDGNYEGGQEEFKYVITRNGNDNWESIINRPYILRDGMILPVLFFNNAATATPVSFAVDMSAQVLLGLFTNGVSSLECRGSFQGWTGGFALTNNPNGANTNLYSGTRLTGDATGTGEEFKFVVDGGNNLGWESINNRSFILAAPPQAVGPFFFNNQDVNDVLPANQSVTFTLYITNGSVGTDGHIFDNSQDSVYINGAWIPWWGWCPANQPCDTGPFSQYQLQNNPIGSDYYTLTLTVPKGADIGLLYKYSINGVDNEAGYAVNHVRYIRKLGGTYALPTDIWQNSYSEPSFGNLAIASPSGNHAMVSWLGRPGVILQTATSMSSAPSWTDRPETANYGNASGTFATNYPTTSAKTFFRLKKL